MMMISTINNNNSRMGGNINSHMVTSNHNINSLTIKRISRKIIMVSVINNTNSNINMELTLSMGVLKESNFD